MKIKAVDFKLSQQITGIYDKYGELISCGDLFIVGVAQYEQHHNGFTLLSRNPNYKVSINFDSYIEVKNVWAE